jgi:hypothetical protein
MSMIINPYQFVVAGGGAYPTGAAALFSLDELNGWTGLIFQGFRESDAATLDFYQGATEGTWNTVRGGGGTDCATWGAGTKVRLTKWYDQSGNANDASQGAFVRMPEIILAGVVHTSGGRHALKCDGTQTVMSLTTNVTAAESFTAFIVGNRSATNKHILGFGGQSYGAYAPWHYTDSFVYANSRSGGLKSNSTDSTITQSLYLVTMAGGTRTLRLNGSSVAATFTASTDSANFEYILGILTGAAEYTDGYVHELGLYSSDQSAENTNIEAFVNNKFTIW